MGKTHPAAQAADLIQGSLGRPLNDAEQDLFWRLYAQTCVPQLERACRSFSRALTDNTLAPEDMLAWIDDRVWRMLKEAGWPIFHDQPTAQEAAARVEAKARLLGRWAYMAQSRKHWRHLSRQQRYMTGLSRTERLAATSSAPADFEHQEEVQQDLARLREKVSARTRANLAASWPERADALRVAVALGATSAKDQAIIERAAAPGISANTIDQMRSRSRREVRAVLGKVNGRLILLALGAVLVLFLAGAHPAQAEGEQTGGRPGGHGHGHGRIAQVAPAVMRDGEQTGGRP